jgi:hypothetical protein
MLHKHSFVKKKKKILRDENKINMIFIKKEKKNFFLVILILDWTLEVQSN